MSNQAKAGLSRRAFIGAGSAMAVGSVAAALAPREARAQATSGAWPVPTLDVNAVRDAGYWGYWANDPYKKTNYGCAYGVAKALIAGIQAGLGPGSAWDSLPLEMFKWGKTGCVESGTLCGALAGALPILSVASPTYVTEMGNDLLRWYQETALPSTELDTLDTARKYPGQAQSVSGSPLCHVSVSRWCAAAGKLAGSTDRKVRCGKLTGDVAKMTATILNRLVPGQAYVPIYGLANVPAAYADCVHCHMDAAPAPTPDATRLNNSLGVSNCLPCHPDAQPVMGKK